MAKVNSAWRNERITYWVFVHRVSTFESMGGVAEVMNASTIRDDLSI